MTAEPFIADVLFPPSTDSGDKEVAVVPKGSPAKVKRLQREEQALELRLKGYSYQQIGEAGGFTHVTAMRYVSRALDRRRAEPTEQLLAIERDRLDGLLKMVHAIIEDDNTDASLRLQAIDRFVKINERRARLLGLDQPVKVDTTTRVQVDYSIDGVDARAIIEGQVMDADNRSSVKAIEQ